MALIPTLSLGLTGLLCGTAALAADAALQAVAEVREPASRTTQSPGHQGHQVTARDGTIDTGAIRYGIRYTACTDEVHGEEVGILEGYIGMPEPAACNWYHSGFLQVRINGAEVGLTPLRDMFVGETGERASIALLWKTPRGPVHVRFLALPGDDRLFCEIGLDPSEPVTQLRIDLKCYPSFFTAHYRRDGRRRLTTPAREAEQGATVELAPAEEWWLAFTDDVFDPAADPDSAGGCAVLFDPEQVAGGSVALGSYAVTGSLEVRPDQRSIRLVFWDFNRLPNATALKQLRQQAADTLAALRDLDFTPRPVRSLDLAQRSAAVAAELRKVTDPGDFPARFEALHRQLTPLVVEVREAAAEGRPPSPEAEQAIIRTLEEYDRLEWELKLHVLLND